MKTLENVEFQKLLNFTKKLEKFSTKCYNEKGVQIWKNLYNTNDWKRG